MTSGEPESWRVEELARRGDVSVDTVRFYQKRRLLPSPRREGRIAWYGPAHLERLGRIRDLQRDGFPLAVIGRILEGELDATDVPLAAAVAQAEDVATDAEPLSATALSERAGVPPAIVEAVVREGLLVPRLSEGQPTFTAADVEIVRAGLRLLETGLPLPELLGLARRYHDSVHDVAEEAVALFDEHVREPLQDADLTDDEKAERLVEAFRVLLPSVTALVEHHFRRVLLQVAQEHLAAVGEPAELAAADAEAVRLDSCAPGVP